MMGSNRVGSAINTSARLANNKWRVLQQTNQRAKSACLLAVSLSVLS
jgi:hypothetical protein